MAWAKNGTPNTLTSTADDVDITDLVAQKFNMFLAHTLGSGNIQTKVTFNNDNGSNYAFRDDAAGERTVTSNPNLTFHYTSADADDTFNVMYLVSISGEEKLAIYFSTDTNGTGAGNAPPRIGRVGKYVPSPDADITRIDANNGQTGNYDIGSNISAIGTD